MTIADSKIITFSSAVELNVRVLQMKFFARFYRTATKVAQKVLSRSETSMPGLRFAPALLSNSLCAYVSIDYIYVPNIFRFCNSSPFVASPR